MKTIARARDLARDLLQEPLPRRWAHTQGVAVQAEHIAPQLGDEGAQLVAAAWLHDIGYAPHLVVTGFHPLDGARYLRDIEGADMHLCRLVAHHSCAAFEAEERDLLGSLLDEFAPLEPGPLVDALIYCDMTTSPDGQRITAEERLAEILSRYGPEHLVGRSIRRARPLIMASVQHVTS